MRPSPPLAAYAGPIGRAISPAVSSPTPQAATSKPRARRLAITLISRFDCDAPCITTEFLEFGNAINSPRVVRCREAKAT